MYHRRIMLVAGLVLGAILFVISHYPFAAEVPDTVELNALGEIYEPVLLDHGMHLDVTSCAVCHHHTTGTPSEDEKCLPCHKGSAATDNVTCVGCHPPKTVTAEKMRSLHEIGVYHIDIAGLKRAYHVKCLGCHREMEVASGCEDCHLKRNGSKKMAHFGD